MEEKEKLFDAKQWPSDKQKVAKRETSRLYLRNAVCFTGLIMMQLRQRLNSISFNRYSPTEK